MNRMESGSFNIIPNEAESSEKFLEILRIHDEVMRQLIEEVCPPDEHAFECADRWRKENEAMFEIAFEDLIREKPFLIEEWGTERDYKEEARAEIKELINAKIMDQIERSDKAA